MAQNVSGSYSTTFYLTSAGQNPLTVLAGAAIITAEPYAILGAATQPWTVSNQGSLSAGTDAVRLTAGGSVTNGSSSLHSASVSGGSTGIYISGGSGAVTNFALIEGSGKPGGVGVSLTGGGTVTNGSATDHTAVITARTGIDISGGSASVVNYGRVVGSRYAISMFGASNSVVNGSASDTGARITGSVYLQLNAYAGRGDQSVTTNYGTINGGVFEYAVQAGVLGITNHGVILGNISENLVYNGSGSETFSNTGSVSGSVYLNDYNSVVAASNAGTIVGRLQISGSYSTAELNNSGLIDGGVSLYAQRTNYPGDVFVNTGTISNASGAGADIYHISTMVNGSPSATSASISGVIGLTEGGAFGSPVVNYGTITGTGGTAVLMQGGPPGYGNNLKMFPSAVFNGQVVALGTALDNGIELAASGRTGKLDGLGIKYIGFGKLSVDPGAVWTLAGSNSLVDQATVSLGGRGILRVTGSLVAGPTLAVAGTGCLAVTGQGRIEVGTAGHAGPGRITVDAGASLVGSGRIGGAVSDAGAIEAQGGTLALGGAIAGRGTVAIDTGATLLAANRLQAANLQFLSGSNEALLLGRPTGVTGRISGFGTPGSGNRIDLLNLAATHSAFSSGTLTVAGAGGVATLRFAGNYTLADFHLTSDGHNGTNISFV